MAAHCPECGVSVQEGSSYCQRCGAFISSEPDGATGAWKIGETGELDAVEAAAEPEGAFLVIRSGGGRSGESFHLVGAKQSIGRRPDSAVFLDDITVSRDHAVVVSRGTEWWIDDCGSLNGTYVNRERIDSQALADGDEVQVGKYRLAFLHR
ncbi:MAG: FHA domain-containing protein [Solirubrobacterales bacterium]|nr:FHA domain-containing protein [Solirubrobacterales bacterium]